MSRQGGVLTGLLLLAAVVANTHLYREWPVQEQGRLEGFPVVLDDWRMTGQYAPSPREIELLETDNILSRTYCGSSGESVNLVLVYDPAGNRKMAHPQEICLTANGLEAISKDSVVLDAGGFPVERLLMEHGGQRTLYYYWYKAGTYQSGDYLRTQLKLAWAALCGRPPGTALVRLSVRVPAAGFESVGDAVLQRFAQALYPELDRQLP